MSRFLVAYFLYQIVAIEPLKLALSAALQMMVFDRPDASILAYLVAGFVNKKML